MTQAGSSKFDYFVESVAGEVTIFRTAYERRIPLLLKGPTGCGKTQLVEFMARQLHKNLIKVSCNEDTNAADLLGRFLIKGADTVWMDGPVTRAVRENAILYLDELAEAREDVVVAIHSLADQRREIYIDKLNETVAAGDSFMLVASYNPGYSQSNRDLKPSTKQRFIVLSMDYPPLDQEKDIVIRSSNCTESVAHKLCTLAQKIRRKPELILQAPVSTRTLIHAATLTVSGIPMRTSAKIAIADVLSDDVDIANGLCDFMNLHL